MLKKMMQAMMPMMSGTMKNMSFSEKNEMMDKMMPHMMTNLTFEEMTQLMGKMMPLMLEDFTFDEAGNLPTDTDPKTLTALHQAERFPVEINVASRPELLRVPGIGPSSADRSLQLRRQTAFRSLSDLRKSGASVHRAAPFILMKGRRPPFQPRLF